MLEASLLVGVAVDDTSLPVDVELPVVGGRVLEASEVALAVNAVSLLEGVALSVVDDD